MLSEIKIDLNALNAKIESFKSLKNEWATYNFSTPELRGSGNTINQLVLLADKYKQLYQDINALIDETILFLEKTRDDYLEADIVSAEQLNKS